MDPLRFLRSVVALAVAAPALALAPAGAATTGPAARVYVLVVVDGTRLTVGSGASAARGQWIVFHVANRGATPARLSFYGRRSALIAPHARGALGVFVLRRGVYPLVVSVGRRRISRSFVVY